MIFLFFMFLSISLWGSDGCFLEEEDLGPWKELSQNPLCFEEESPRSPEDFFVHPPTHQETTTRPPLSPEQAFEIIQTQSTKSLKNMLALKEKLPNYFAQTYPWFDIYIKKIDKIKTYTRKKEFIENNIPTKFKHLAQEYLESRYSKPTPPKKKSFRNPDFIYY